MEIYKQMLVVVTDLYVGHGVDPMGPCGLGRVDSLGIVTEVDRENQVATVETKGYGCFATIPLENLIPLVELAGKDYHDPEEALRDFLPEVIVCIAVKVNTTSRGLTKVLGALVGNVAQR